MLASPSDIHYSGCFPVALFMNYLIKPLIQSITRNIRKGRKLSEPSQHGTEASKVSTHQSKEWPEHWTTKPCPGPEVDQNLSPLLLNGLGSGPRTWACFSSVKVLLGYIPSSKVGSEPDTKAVLLFGLPLQPASGSSGTAMSNLIICQCSSQYIHSQHLNYKKHAAHMAHRGMITNSKTLSI